MVHAGAVHTYTMVGLLLLLSAMSLGRSRQLLASVAFSVQHMQTYIQLLHARASIPCGFSMQQLHALSTCQWPRSPPPQVRRLDLSLGVMHVHFRSPFYEDTLIRCGHCITEYPRSRSLALPRAC